MLIQRTYQLVDASARYKINLCDYRQAITRAAELSFRELFCDIDVQSTYFTLTLDSDTPKVKHGLLVNFGKTIAKQTHGLCEEAMRTYQSDKHPPSRQLFRCCE
ncbi:hypothetical protein JK211_04350 [Tatumella sp. JGM130]|uniref:hypothetical protein n=1 Tax=Tatumella sp. JGM130 TaxID=2799797 RepID=UPI001BAF5686|nr:hypothetical protein [Tatumella sp. JGM130]MBS0893262.1 hypothetical protein [Tatumella sp. JGM130]